MLRIIQVGSYVAAIVCVLAAVAIRFVPAMHETVAARGILELGMAGFLCSIATHYIAQASEEPKEEAKTKAVAA